MEGSEKRRRLIKFIRSVHPMPPEEAEKISLHFEEAQFKKNDFIFFQNKVCNEYHFLAEGFVRAFTHDLEGNEVTTAFYSAGGVVCDIYSFFKRVPAGESFQALSHCSTLCLNFESLQSVFHNMLHFREFGRTILVNSYSALKVRMLSMLHKTAEQRYRELIEANPEVFQYSSLKSIASYLGVTDTSLSRIRKEISRS